MTPSALLYIRVSSKEQEKEGYSLDAQEKLGREYAQRKGFKIAKMWKVAESAWSKNTARTAFIQMIEYAKNHPEIRHIIFDITDRMTRNDSDKIKINDLIHNYKKIIHFSRSNKIYDKDSSPDDVFMLDIEVAVAKKMSNDISRKTRMGMIEKASQGIYPSFAPLGYINNKQTRQLDVNPLQRDHLKNAFMLMASGRYSLDSLAKHLFQVGLRTNRGAAVNKSTVSHVLNNPFYYGIYTWRDTVYQGKHEPIITKDLFECVQKVLRGRFTPHQNKKHFAFNNLIACGECGCNILGEEKRKPSGRKYNYYHCSFSKGRHKGKAYVPENRLAEMFDEPIRRITMNEDFALWLKEALEESFKDSVKYQEVQIRSLKTQEDRIKKRLNNLYDEKYDGGLDVEVFNTKENEYKKQLTELKNQIEKIEQINPDLYRKGIQTLELIKLLPSQWVRANLEEKGQIIRRLASNCTLNDVTLCVTYKRPFSFLAEGSDCSRWLPSMDSNHDNEIQILVCYHYTTGQ